MLYEPYLPQIPLKEAKKRDSDFKNTPFELLPIEIIKKIAIQLEPKDLINLEYLSKNSKAICEHLDHVLWYHIIKILPIENIKNIHCKKLYKKCFECPHTKNTFRICNTIDEFLSKMNTISKSGESYPSQDKFDDS